MRFDNKQVEIFEDQQDLKKYKKVFDLEEHNTESDGKDQLALYQVGKGLINGSQFTQLRIPKRINHRMEIQSVLTEEEKLAITFKDNEMFLKWRRDLHAIEN